MPAFPFNKARIYRRQRAEKRLKFYCRSALILILLFLVTLLGGIFLKSLPAFYKHQIDLEIMFDPAHISLEGQCQLTALASSAYITPDLLSPASCQVLVPYLRAHPETLGQRNRIWVPVSDDVDLFLKNSKKGMQRLNLTQIQNLESWKQKKRLRKTFNKKFFTQGDSRTPEFAGLASALVGSFYLILIALLVAFPLGVAAAVYLEEFQRPHAFVSWIDVSIANLAAVPSIVFGLLGLALFLGFFGLPRSSPLVGGLTLGIMILPVILITTRSALRAVPQTIRFAAQALGASTVQVVAHHVLPLALPGIITGTLIAAARTLGETAPLLMIGMMAFISDIPSSPSAPASALPIQIFMWARSPEPGFIAHAAAGILVLLIFLGIMSIGAIMIRQKFEHRWTD